MGNTYLTRASLLWPNSHYFLIDNYLTNKNCDSKSIQNFTFSLKFFQVFSNSHLLHIYIIIVIFCLFFLLFPTLISQNDSDNDRDNDSANHKSCQKQRNDDKKKKKIYLHFLKM